MHLDQEKLSYLRLARSAGVGPITFYALLKKHGTAKEAVYELLTNNIYGDNIKVTDSSMIEQEICNVEAIHGKIITYDEQYYPKYLKSLRDAPPIITALGNVELLQKEKNIAVVGSRNASYNSCKIAKQISYDMATNGFTIISGLAAGVDTSAHHVIEHKLPTIAVLANGINIAYPRRNSKLYNDIIENGGLVITEFPYNVDPKPQHFPQRNRIISGLSLGVVVVEAGMKSGSLITAKCALAQGREVFSVPGSPLDDRCKGSNYLLKEGAILVESSDDVMMGLNLMTQHKLQQHSLFDCHDNSALIDISDIKTYLLTQLSYSPSNIDELILDYRLDVKNVLSALSELEIEKN